MAIHDENVHVAIISSLIYKRKQVWIEGIRVNENFRRKGYNSKNSIIAIFSDSKHLIDFSLSYYNFRNN